MKCIAVCLTSLWILLVVAVQANDEIDTAQDAYIDMPLEELLQLEIPLDDVFDVFDGLRKARQVSIASGKREDAAWAPAVTTVITAQDIEAMGARDLDEVLETVPGLHVTRVGLAYSPVYVIRGIYSPTNPEVLILINGISIKSLDSGDRGLAWAGMPVQMIERVEVIRGPGSAVYGADAFSGVINIITKQANDIAGTELGGRHGSFDTYDTWLIHGSDWGDTEIAFSLEYQDTNGQHEAINSDFQSSLDALLGTQASFAPGEVNLGRRGLDTRLDLAHKNWRLRASYQGRRDVESGVGVIGAIDPLSAMQSDRLGADLTYQSYAIKNWEILNSLSIYEQRTRVNVWILPPGTASLAGNNQFAVYPDGIISQPDLSERRINAQLSGFYSGFKRHKVRLGIGYSYEDMYEVKFATNIGVDRQGRPILPGSPVVDLTDSPFSLIPEEIRKNWYVFVQDTWYITDTWGLSLGVRYDDYSDFGHTLNPRLAFIWQVYTDLNVKLMYGRAFRAPAFRELYITNNGLAVGNQNLDAEKLENWELAFDWMVTDRLHLGLTTYMFNIEDKISIIPIPDSPFSTYANLNEWRGRGFELEARWKVNSITGILFNFAQANVKESDQELGVYPKRQFYLRADFLLFPEYFNDWYLDAQYNWVGDRARQLGDSRNDLGDDSTVDLTLRYKKPNGHINFALGIRNLFDTDLREPYEPNLPEDLPLPGRNYFVELRYRF